MTPLFMKLFFIIPTRIYPAVKKAPYTFIVLVLCFSVLGCSTLKALEPTAILITDIAKAL